MVKINKSSKIKITGGSYYEDQKEIWLLTRSGKIVCTQ